MGPHCLALCLNKSIVLVNICSKWPKHWHIKMHFICRRFKCLHLMVRFRLVLRSGPDCFFFSQD